ncbi:unnamed protein product, partial [Amoebophrya sp. A25]
VEGILSEEGVQQEHEDHGSSGKNKSFHVIDTRRRTTRGQNGHSSTSRASRSPASPVSGSSPDLLLDVAASSESKKNRSRRTSIGASASSALVIRPFSKRDGTTSGTPSDSANNTLIAAPAARVPIQDEDQ